MVDLETRLMRSVEKLLYNETLKRGLTPDRLAYANNEIGFEAKEKEIRNTYGFCIGIFGNGTDQDKATKYVPRFSIKGLGFLTGTVGNDWLNTLKLNKDETAFEQYTSPPASAIYRFQLELASNKSFQSSTLEKIKARALPNRSYVSYYDNPDERFLLTYGPLMQSPDMGQHLNQRRYLYEIVDVFEQQPEILDGDVARMKTFTVKEPDGTIIAKTPKS